MALVAQSYQSCETYKRALLFGSRASNFGFDLLTTVFSALGTAFTPVSTVHAFTAAATITTGSKTALDADVYMNATAPLMAQALSQVYDDKMRDLKARIEAAPDRAPGIYFADVVAVHNTCSLTEAMVSLQSLETQKALSTAKITSADVTAGATFTLGSGGEVQVTTITASATGPLAAYTLKTADPAATPVAQPVVSVPLLVNLLNTLGATKKAS